MIDLQTSLGWCCTDCLMLLANGDTSGNPYCETEEAQEAWLALIEAKTQGCEMTLGMMREEHASDCDANETGSDCECETTDFSMSSCDVCGSRLGGSRHAVTFWFEKEKS